MADIEGCLLSDIEPNLAGELETLLARAGREALASQIRTLSISERRDSRYGSDFYVEGKPDGPWGADYQTLELSPGALMVDVVRDRIVMIEVLRNRLGRAP